MYLDGGYPEGQLVEVEALRYLYLDYVAKNRDKSKDGEKIGKTFLVPGDYIEENTIRQMELLQNASKLLNDKVQFLVKPHPACPIDASLTEGIELAYADFIRYSQCKSLRN
jgi:surface carbohydrate biosynthesis protein (TIGR04326 family)